MFDTIYKSFKLTIYCLNPNVFIISRRSGGLGDQLFMTALAREIKKVSPKSKIVVESKMPELFSKNPYIDIATGLHVKALKRFKVRYRIDDATKTHVLDQLYEKLPFRFHQPERKLNLFLTDDESKYGGDIPTPFVTICPSSKKGFAANRKEWGMENFQKVRDHFSHINFVQIGTDEPLLKNVIDMRGLKIRKSAALIKRALFFIGLEGGLMHLANAVGKKGIIIFGGYLHPRTTGYSENINIYTEPECSPCCRADERHTDCESMRCMKEIKPDQVIKVVEDLLIKENLYAA